MDFGGWGIGEDLRGLKGRETVIGIYFIKKFIFNKKVLDHFFLFALSHFLHTGNKQLLIQLFFLSFLSCLLST